MTKIDNPQGMTIVELVVVSLLVAVLSAILYSTLNGIARARESTEKTETADQTAHYIFSRLSLEIASRSYAPLMNRKDQESEGSGFPSGGVPIYMLGVDKKAGESDRDSLRFISSGAAQPLIGAPSNYGLMEVEYRLEEGGDHLPQENNKHTPLTLVREEVPAATNSEEILKKRKVTLPLAENVASLNFRFLKEDNWVNEWKTSNPPLPQAIEITLEIIRGDGETEVFRTAVPIAAKVRQPTS